MRVPVAWAPADLFVFLRSSSVLMEQELSLDGAVVSAVFHESMDMGVVGTTAGTVWFVSWAQGTSTRLISGHYCQVRPHLGSCVSVCVCPYHFSLVCSAALSCCLAH